MTRATLLFLLLLLLPDARAQAPAIRPPARPVVPPALTPGYHPNTPPDPAHTPPGTGLPEVGQPGTHAVPVKRSPNTRALPDEFDPKKEPGVWAADGAPTASSAPRLFDVEIPLPSGTASPSAPSPFLSCILGMAHAANDWHAVVAFPEPVRRCMAARAIEQCVTYKALHAGDATGQARRQGWRQHPPDAKTREHIRGLAEQWCAGIRFTPEQTTTYERITEAWEWAETSHD